jgi:uncharacterized protein (DUF1499 family)
MIGAAGAAAVALFGVAHRRWWVMNDITTGETPQYPDLPPHVYAADIAATRSAAEAACRALPRWTVVRAIGDSDDTPAPLRAEVRTALFSFTDDVTVRFEPVEAASGADGAPHTRVVIRSHSRVGKGDLGENERHIRALQQAMDSRLARVSPPGGHGG